MNWYKKANGETLKIGDKIRISPLTPYGNKMISENGEWWEVSKFIKAGTTWSIQQVDSYTLKSLKNKKAILGYPTSHFKIEEIKHEAI